jgi:hypothetical protein
MTKKMILGALEKCDLPELGIFDLQVRVDTGAATSSLHVNNIEEQIRGEEHWITFDIHPDYHDVATVTTCSALVLSQRKVKSSTANLQRRYVIKTPIKLGNALWDIQLTLTDRSAMTYLMLLGREAICGKFIVDPEIEYALS